MLADLWMALRHGRNQFQFWRQTYSPFSRWRDATDAVISRVLDEASRYGISNAGVDRRRALQVARMNVPNRHGEHVADVLPDAYWHYAPTSKATVHSGRKEYPSIEERRNAFMTHPQTLAYLMTPPPLSRLGIGRSPKGGLVVIKPGEDTVEASGIAQRLWKAVDGDVDKPRLEEYADRLARLHAGPAGDEEKDAKAA